MYSTHFTFSINLSISKKGQLESNVDPVSRTLNKKALKND